MVVLLVADSSLKISVGRKETTNLDFRQVNSFGLFRELKDSSVGAIVFHPSAGSERGLAARLSAELEEMGSSPAVFVMASRSLSRFESDLTEAGIAWNSISTLADEKLSAARPHFASAVRQSEDLGLVGASAAMRRIREVVRLVARRSCTVLISGETGTGKEVLARAIHQQSDRVAGPLVAINCAALPASLLESELFGHVRGAFTGADRDHKGRIQQADGGTLLLDEIGDMPLEVQAKVLRVLQERVVQPLGGTKSEPVDVRIVAATNVNLKEAVRQGRFRADLFYRLNVVPIEIPPLRDRSEDVAPLVSHFLNQICKRERLPLKTVTPSVEHCLADQAWPGNVRELEHAIERAIALSGDRTDLDIYDFEPFSSVMALSDAVSDAPIEGRVDFEGMVSQFERALIDGALRRAVGNKARAANMLRLKRSTFISKIKALEVCA